MKVYSQDLSRLMDNELDNEEIIDELLDNAELQQEFSRYQLIGSVIRDETNGVDLKVDVTDAVMAAIKEEPQEKLSPPNNVIPFMKRFGQYAIAASVAGVVVVSSLVMNQSADNDPSVTPVLNTVPFGGIASPVNLQTTPSQTQLDIKERNERLEALLKDHQLQLQTKP